MLFGKIHTASQFAKHIQVVKLSDLKTILEITALAGGAIKGSVAIRKMIKKNNNSSSSKKKICPIEPVPPTPGTGSTLNNLFNNYWTDLTGGIKGQRVARYQALKTEAERVLETTKKQKLLTKLREFINELIKAIDNSSSPYTIAVGYDPNYETKYFNYINEKWKCLVLNNLREFPNADKRMKLSEQIKIVKMTYENAPPYFQGWGVPDKDLNEFQTKLKSVLDKMDLLMTSASSGASFDREYNNVQTELKEVVTLYQGKIRGKVPQTPGIHQRSRIDAKIKTLLET